MTADFYLYHEQEGDRLAAAGYVADAAAAYDAALALRPQASWIVDKRRRLDAPAKMKINAVEGLPFILFTPYYPPSDSERAAELRYCLDRNLESGLFARIFLMVDDDSAPPRQDRRLSVMRMGRRPTYLDWVRESRRLFPGQISILANSDIYFDDSVGRLLEIFEAEPDAFIALTRFDKDGQTLTPHPDPHWSQDCWAFMPKPDDSEIHDKRLDVPLGVPRCDNKVAYVFATQGYRVYNPLPHVRAVHVHETNIRNYKKKGDRRVIGGVAMVHPGKGLLEPAQLDIEVWSERSDQVTGVKLNRTLENWNCDAVRAAEPRPTWLAHDRDWQYPVITEQHAFHRMRALLGDAPQVTSAVYLGFPFATLIDLHVQHGPENARTRALQAALDELAPKLKSYERVVTVTQHIHAGRCAHLFAGAGVTDLFWSHASTGDRRFPSSTRIVVRPFPLYPVQQEARGPEDIGRARRWLFSFVGSRAPDYYLTRARNHIIDLLGADPRGKVVARDGWHFNKIVYDAQVYERVSAQHGGLINDVHSEDFKSVMDETTFALCPSGSGPNSIRLWEAMLNGAIPVILSDNWIAPGDPALWEAATLRCEETPAAIAALPDRLAAIAADPARLRAMREALLTLVEWYGPEGFVGDVIAVMGASE